MLQIEELPIVLTAIEICEILKVSKPTAYDLMESENFPLIRFGRSKRVMRDKFFEWLENIEEIA